MAVKAVFFDIDGTLLNDRKKVSRTTQKAIVELKKQGIFVGLATGRGPAFVAPFMENLGLDFAVTFNGQYIISRDRVIYQNQLPKSTVYRLIKYAQERRREVSLGTSVGLLGSNIINMGTSRFGQVASRLVPERLTKLVERSFKNIIRRIKPQNLGTLQTIMREPVYQVVMVATEGETSKIQDKFPHIKITRSSPYSADLISEGQSKIKGIERLGQAFDFDLSEVMTFGDSENDIEMLLRSGIGVAMGNATEAAKQTAHYITDSNNQNGIAKALSHYGLIHLESENDFLSDDENFNKVRDFHRLMDGETNNTPRVFGLEEASHRADFKLEEIVEFIYATASSREDFAAAMTNLHTALDKAARKVQSKEHPESPLVGQVDALIDLLYLTYGSFVLMGVDPSSVFNSVHAANMGKIFPDGKAHFDPVTHKVLKPDDWEARFAPEPAIKQEVDRQLRKALRRQTDESSRAKEEE